MVDRFSNYSRHSEIPHSSHTSFSGGPSFSSTLLDAIYQSIDRGEEQMVVYREPMIKKKRDDAQVRGMFESEEEMSNFWRACMIEKWMEKKVAEKGVGRTKSQQADVQVKKPWKDRRESSSSSSDSSCCGGGGGGGGFFSSSEAESLPVQRPKPVRTGGPEKLGKDRRGSEIDSRGFGGEFEEKSKNESGFLRTKSRALQIYGDLKRVKQPISPGGKLAGFFNSILTARSLRKPKIRAACGDDSPSLKSTNASTCSSGSSFSRSCLSKTPSLKGKSSGGEKRSVRFFPVSVIVGEDCQPCGHKSLHQENNKNNISNIKTAIDDELMVHIREKSRRADDAGDDFPMHHQKKNQMRREFELPFEHLRKTRIENQGFDQDFLEKEEEEDEFDATSCSSSDLFELDNLSAIGMERYTEELPVYETTHLHTNRAIANGLIL